MIEVHKTKTIATRYDVAEHLRTPEHMVAYLEASLEEANGHAAFIMGLQGQDDGRDLLSGGDGRQAKPLARRAG